MKLVRNVSITLATSVLSSGATALAALVVANSLGAKGAGIFALARVTPTVVVSLLGAGITISNAYLVGGRRYSVQAITETSVALALLLGGAGLAGWMVCGGLLKAHFFRTLPDEAVLVLGVAIPVLMLRNYLNSIQQGLQTFTEANLVLFIEDFGALLFVLPLLWGDPEGRAGHLLIVFASVGGAALSCAAVVWCLMRRRIWPWPWLHPAIAKEMIWFGVKGHVGRIANTLNWRLDIMILSTLGSTEAVGYYAVATKVAEAIRPLSGALNYVLRPLIASLPAREAQVKTVSLYRRFFTINLATVAIMGFASGPLITHLFGADFAAAIPACQVLLIGLAAFGPDGVLNGYNVGIGRPEFNTYGAVVGLGITIVGDLLLIPRFSLMGAAVTSAIAYTARAVTLTAIFLATAGLTVSELIGLGFHPSAPSEAPVSAPDGEAAGRGMAASSAGVYAKADHARP